MCAVCGTQLTEEQIKDLKAEFDAYKATHP
jgi:DNA primase